MSGGSPTSSSPPESGQTAVDKLRVIIVGATKEGRDLLELFSRDPSIVLVAIADHDPDAPGLDVAKKLSIPISTDPLALITHAAADLIVDLTGDADMTDGIRRHASRHTEIMGGRSALLLWKLTQQERELYRQLIEAEKRASIGTLASGIAHEINNPLYIMMGLSEHLRTEARPHLIAECVDGIMKAGQRIAVIVKDLNTFARRSRQEGVCEIDIRTTLDEAVRIVRLATNPTDLHVTTEYGSIPAVRGKPEDVLQIFLNLLTNAVQAMEGRGTLTLSTSVGERMVSVIVKDTGPGIPENNLTKVFDPFFTTREPGAGTGLGLHIVREIVTLSGGQVKVDSVLGQGAAFTVALPAAAES